MGSNLLSVSALIVEMELYAERWLVERCYMLAMMKTIRPNTVLNSALKMPNVLHLSMVGWRSKEESWLLVDHLLALLCMAWNPKAVVLGRIMYMLAAIPMVKLGTIKVMSTSGPLKQNGNSSSNASPTMHVNRKIWTGHQQVISLYLRDRQNAWRWSNQKLLLNLMLTLMLVSVILEWKHLPMPMS